MYRLDDKDTRIVFSQVQKQGTTAFEHGNELFVSGPCRIKEDVIAEMSDAVYYITGIVQRTIVGIQLDDCQAERSGLLRLFRIPFGRELSQIHFVEAMSINAADKAVRIPGRFQVHRRSPGLYECADSHGFMIIPVIEHQISRSKKSIGHNTVGCGRPIENKVRLIRMKDLSRKIL